MPIKTARSLLLLVLALGHSAAWADAAARSWSYSGRELMQAIDGKFPDGTTQNPAMTQQSSAQAMGYVLGVADSIEPGRCQHVRVLPHEQVARVYEHLKTLSPQTLRGNAAPLVRSALAC